MQLEKKIFFHAAEKSIAEKKFTRVQESASKMRGELETLRDQNNSLEISVNDWKQKYEEEKSAAVKKKKNFLFCKFFSRQMR